MSSTWKLENERATVNLGDWEIELAPTAPSDGLKFGKQGKLVWNALCVQPQPAHGLKTEEAYCREGDLIVRFDQSESDKFAFGLDWRVLATEQAQMAGVEMWASVQTDDLDSEPVLVLSSCAAEGEYWDVLSHADLTGQPAESGAATPRGPAALISRSRDSTALWLIEPSDQRHAEMLSSPSEAQQRIELFGHFMEKGVIRRARMQFYVCDGDLSRELIHELYVAFANSPLPLTA